MKDLIRRIIREELTPSIRRRLKFGDIEKILNQYKINNFKKNQPIEDSITTTIRQVLYEVMPHEFEDDDIEYYKVWDEIKEYIKDNYTEELTQYFEKRQRDAEEEERNSTGEAYIFVKHDKPYGNRDWRGFAEGFKSFDEMITKYGHWVDVDWDEVKNKLDSINEYPEDTFSGTINSRPLRILSIGDEGNTWGYNFSIIKSMPKDRLKEIQTEENNDELDEYARTLKNARKQGSGLRFPKSAIKSNPLRFRPYNREMVDETDPKVGTGKKPEGSDRRLYTDENPSDTVSVKFRTKEDIIDTLNKDSFKSKPHNRQSQIINLIHQRVRAAYQNAKDPETKQRLKRAYDYIENVKEKSKEKTIRLQKEGLDDKWTHGEDTVTLKQLLKITKDIPVTKMSTKKLMKHALHGDNPEEMKKVDKTSLKYPVLVLVSDKGLIKYILDGHHRIQKANKYDIKMVNVKLIKFSELPKNFKKVLGGEKEEQNEGELTERCWKGYTQKGMKTMFGKRYPNCVKIKK